MPKLATTAKFDKAVSRMDATGRRRVSRALAQFAVDILHPGLNFEKIKGTPYCSIRVSRSARIVLRATDTDTFDLIDVGDHDTMYRRHG